MKKILVLVALLSFVVLSGCNQISTNECEEFRCYYGSDTGGSLQIEYPDLGCPMEWQEMNLFYVECKSR